MGYNSYYGYSYSPFYFLGSGTPIEVLSIIAFVAAIVCTVIGYRRYISTGNVYNRINRSDARGLAPFLRFDTLILEKILKALYLFSSLHMVFEAIAILISSIFTSAQVFMYVLLGVVIILPILELLNRLLYEFLMLNVIIARNTSDIKNMMLGEAMPAQGAPFNPVAPNTPAQGPAMGGGAAPQNCCPYCNTPLKPGQKFCGVCGNKLG